MYFQKNATCNWERLFVDKIIETYNDDRTYLYILYLNGYTPRTCSKYDVRSLTHELANNNNNNRLKSVSKTFKRGREYDNCVKDIIVGLTGKTIDNSFGYFNDKTGSTLKNNVYKADVANKARAIKKLREDMQSGKIVKVPTVGGFIWKRVK